MTRRARKYRRRRHKRRRRRWWRWMLRCNWNVYFVTSHDISAALLNCSYLHDDAKPS